MIRSLSNRLGNFKILRNLAPTGEIVNLRSRVGFTVFKEGPATGGREIKFIKESIGRVSLT